MMKVKKLKRKCSVRGCKNVANVYALSKTREMGNSVIMCSDCMKEALQSIKELDVTLSSVAEGEPKPEEVIEDVTEDAHISAAEDTVTTTEEPEPIPTITPTSKPKNTTNTKQKSKKK